TTFLEIARSTKVVEPGWNRRKKLFGWTNKSLGSSQYDEKKFECTNSIYESRWPTYRNFEVCSNFYKETSKVEMDMGERGGQTVWDVFVERAQAEVDFTHPAAKKYALIFQNLHNIWQAFKGSPSGAMLDIIMITLPKLGAPMGTCSLAPNGLGPLPLPKVTEEQLDSLTVAMDDSPAQHLRKKFREEQLREMKLDEQKAKLADAKAKAKGKEGQSKKKVPKKGELHIPVESEAGGTGAFVEHLNDLFKYLVQIDPNQKDKYTGFMVLGLFAQLTGGVAVKSGGGLKYIKKWSAMRRPMKADAYKAAALEMVKYFAKNNPAMPIVAHPSAATALNQAMLATLAHAQSGATAPTRKDAAMCLASAAAGGVAEIIPAAWGTVLEAISIIRSASSDGNGIDISSIDQNMASLIEHGISSVEKLKSGMPKALFDIFARSTVEFHEFASAWVEAGMGVACVCVKVDVAEYLETKRRVIDVISSMPAKALADHIERAAGLGPAPAGMLARCSAPASCDLHRGTNVVKLTREIMESVTPKVDVFPAERQKPLNLVSNQFETKHAAEELAVKLDQRGIALIEVKLAEEWPHMSCVESLVAAAEEARQEAGEVPCAPDAEIEVPDEMTIAQWEEHVAKMEAEDTAEEKGVKLTTQKKIIAAASLYFANRARDAVTYGVDAGLKKSLSIDIKGILKGSGEKTIDKDTRVAKASLFRAEPVTTAATNPEMGMPYWGNVVSEQVALLLPKATTLPHRGQQWQGPCTFLDGSSCLNVFRPGACLAWQCRRVKQQQPKTSEQTEVAEPGAEGASEPAKKRQRKQSTPKDQQQQPVSKGQAVATHKIEWVDFSFKISTRGEGDVEFTCVRPVLVDSPDPAVMAVIGEAFRAPIEFDDSDPQKKK
ncbi:unnamed protein product, partial [Prorocentrum cordatum]